MGFLNDASLTVGPDNEWVLDHDFFYGAENGEAIVVPAGFITDLASIPQIFQNIVPVNGRHRQAAILHDFLYVIQDRPRASADALFLEAMASSGVRFAQRWVMYLAVRAAGWVVWDRGAASRRKDLVAHLRRSGL